MFWLLAPATVAPVSRLLEEGRKVGKGGKVAKARCEV